MFITLIIGIFCSLMFALWIWEVFRRYKKIRVSQGFTEKEKIILTRQVTVLLPALLLPILFAFITFGAEITFAKIRLFIRIATLLIYPSFVYIAVSSLKYQVSFSKSGPIKGNSAIITGSILIIGLILYIVFWAYLFFLGFA